MNFFCGSVSWAIRPPCRCSATSQAGSFFPTMGVLILAGTRKGLFTLRSDDDRREWKLEGPTLTGWDVFHATRDPRDGALLACTNNWVYGASIHRSTDEGATWERSEGLGLPEDS